MIELIFESSTVYFIRIHLMDRFKARSIIFADQSSGNTCGIERIQDADFMAGHAQMTEDLANPFICVSSLFSLMLLLNWFIEVNCVIIWDNCRWAQLNSTQLWNMIKLERFVDKGIREQRSSEGDQGAMAPRKFLALHLPPIF